MTLGEISFIKIFKKGNPSKSGRSREKVLTPERGGNKSRKYKRKKKDANE